MVLIPRDVRIGRYVRYSAVAILLATTGIALSNAGAGAASPAKNANAALVQRGEEVFGGCLACHTIDEDAGNRLGPNLYNVYGSNSGSNQTYAYSAALKKARLKWTDANLDRYLTAPSKTIPGTKMGFPGLQQPADRAAVIAYIKSNSKAAGR